MRFSIVYDSKKIPFLSGCNTLLSLSSKTFFWLRAHLVWDRHVATHIVPECWVLDSRVVLKRSKTGESQKNTYKKPTSHTSHTHLSWTKYTILFSSNFWTFTYIRIYNRHLHHLSLTIPIPIQFGPKWTYFKKRNKNLTLISEEWRRCRIWVKRWT